MCVVGMQNVNKNLKVPLRAENTVKRRDTAIPESLATQTPSATQSKSGGESQRKAYCNFFRFNKAVDSLTDTFQMIKR